MNHLVGHEKIYENFLNLYKDNKLPNKIIINGKKGIGKFHFIKKFLNFIYENNENTENLINKMTHPNIFYIKKSIDKKFIEISQIREMIKFQNSSSFNNKVRSIIIDDLEYLNLNSANSLLKSLEEPNNNVIFFLINNAEFKILDTIKSRCIEFKTLLTPSEIKIIVDNFFNGSKYDLISSDFKCYYNSPAFLISLIKYFEDNEIVLNEATIEQLFYHVIKNKSYIKDSFVINNLNFFIELFFYKKINYNNISYNLKDYFIKKIFKIKKYNLDLETFFLEFEEKLLNE